MQRELEAGSGECRVGTTTYTSVEAAKLAEAKLECIRTLDATLLSLTETLDTRRRVLDASRKKYSAILEAKQQLTVEIGSLEARQKLMEVTRTSADSKVDDSLLTRTRDLLQSIETRIKVEERLATNELAGIEVVPQSDDDVDSRHVACRIADYFKPSNLLSEADLGSTY